MVNLLIIPTFCRFTRWFHKETFVELKKMFLNFFNLWCFKIELSELLLQNTLGYFVMMIKSNIKGMKAWFLAASLTFC